MRIEQGADHGGENMSPAPAAMPSAATAHSDAAVVRPRTVPAMLEDRARPDEADAGHDLRGDARRIGADPDEGVAADDGEDRRAQRDERVGAEAGRLALQLALEADDAPRARGRRPAGSVSSSCVSNRAQGHEWLPRCASARPRRRAAPSSSEVTGRDQAWSAPTAEDEAEPDRHEAYQQERRTAVPLPAGKRTSIGAQTTRSSEPRHDQQRRPGTGERMPWTDRGALGPPQPARGRADGHQRAVAGAAHGSRPRNRLTASPPTGPAPPRRGRRAGRRGTSGPPGRGPNSSGVTRPRRDSAAPREPRRPARREPRHTVSATCRRTPPGAVPGSAARTATSRGRPGQGERDAASRRTATSATG